MKFILDNPQVLLVLAAVVFSGLQKLWQMKRAREEHQPWQPDEADFRPVEDFQPGLPKADLPRRASVPPPLSRQMPPPLSRSTPPAFARYTAAEEEPELERQRKMQERLKALRDSQKATSAAAKILAKKKTRPTGPVVSPSKLRDRLRNPKEVRQAIVMREILGPPVSLK